MTLFASVLFITLAFTPMAANTSAKTCQEEVDALSIDAVISNPCDGTKTSCPASCKSKLDAVDAVCKGKKVTVTGSKESTDYDTSKIGIVFIVEAFAQGDACKNVMFDEGLAAAVTCPNAFTFGVHQMVFSPHCSVETGGASATTCDPSCQKAIGNVFAKCKAGDTYDPAATDKWDPVAGVLGLSAVGPSSCDYKAPAASGNATATKASTSGSSISHSLVFMPFIVFGCAAMFSAKV